MGRVEHSSPYPAPPGPAPTMGMAWASHGVSKPQTYHARSQEHRHIVAVPQAHLQEEEITPAGIGAPAGKEAWWAWGNCSFQVPAPACPGGRGAWHCQQGGQARTGSMEIRGGV